MLTGGDIAAPPATIRMADSVDIAEDCRLSSGEGGMLAGVAEVRGCGLVRVSCMEETEKTRGEEDGLIPIPELVDWSVDRRLMWDGMEIGEEGLRMELDMEGRDETRVRDRR